MSCPSPHAVPAHLGWRLLALVYDLFPALAVLLFFGALATGFAALLGHADLSDLPWAGPLLAFGAWAFVGAYFVLSWQRGGQTLGMRPWRLRVVAADGRPATARALTLRYAAASLPALLLLEAAGLLPWADRLLPFWIAGAGAAAGLLWSLVDDECAALHDRVSRTRLVRLIDAV